ncbi:MBL fold metallo-hydrolase [Halopiger djelfimassiliensis]|uniref:MBL fold metallo-hydrolase n=1 Tax=Halopiger djelfimassiliensis TaxID=1293047 RepID=UPI000677B485|nr:MBL fold metallo-hydrolase [Halopiger djelfimassiliensis]
MSDSREQVGVHALPITIEYGGRELTVTPTLVETRRGLVLIDAGPEGSLEPLRTHVRSLGHELADVWLVVLTHHDGDHAGGLAALLEETDAIVATHRDEAPFVSGDRDPLKGDGNGRYRPVPVDLELAGGVRIPTLAGPMVVLETPGHTPGHVSLLFPEDGLLLAGDALVADGEEALTGPKPAFTHDVDRALESVRDLSDRRVDHVVCYHGGYVDRGTERLREIYEHRSK